MATYIIKATYIGSNAGPFDIVDSLGNTLATGITAAEILAGYQVTVDDAATSVTLLSADCGSFVIPIVPGTTTTSTTSTTSTTTVAPTTTSTTSTSTTTSTTTLEPTTTTSTSTTTSTTSTTTSTTSTTSTTTCDCSITAEGDVYVYEGPAEASTTTTTTTAAPFYCTMPQYTATRTTANQNTDCEYNAILVTAEYPPTWGIDVGIVHVTDENGNILGSPQQVCSPYPEQNSYFINYDLGPNVGYLLDNGATTLTITAQGPKCFNSVTVTVQ